MINQLRLYKVRPELREMFLARFRDHAARIMRDRYGFRILAMWVERDAAQLRFIYLLSWADAAEKTEAWRRFMADEEWAEVKRKSRIPAGEPVIEVEDIELHAVPFSAPLTPPAPAV